MLTFKRTDSGERTDLVLGGVLDATTAASVRPTIDKIVQDGRKDVVLVLSELRLIDSSGVGALVSLLKRVRAGGGEVRVSGLQDQPLVIFRLLKLDRVFPRLE